MNYICLAAGKGSRMGNLGSYLQKCMYPVGDKPFVELTIKSLMRAKCFNKSSDRLIFVIGHHCEQIVRYFGNEYCGLRIDYVYQEKPIGTGHAVKIGYSKADETETTLIFQADNYIKTEDFEKIAENKYADCLMVFNHICGFDHNERVDLDGDKIACSWKGKSDFIESGLWKFSKELIDAMDAQKEDEYRALLNVQAAIERGTDVGYIVEDEWLHLGGTEPSVNENLKYVLKRVSEIEAV